MGTQQMASIGGGGPAWNVALVGGDDAIARLLGDAGASVCAYESERLPGRRSDDDLVVMAAQAADETLISVADSLRTCAGGVPTVIVAERAVIGLLGGLLAAGVQGVVLREAAESTLVPTCAAVIAGQVCVPGDGAQAIQRPDLSVREKQVIGLLAMGLRNREIGERLYITESTVKSHLSSAFAKLGVRTRRQAADLVLRASSGLGPGILYLDAEPLAQSADQAR